MTSTPAQEFLSEQLLEMSSMEEPPMLHALNMISLASETITESLLRGYLTMAGLDYRDPDLARLIRTYIDAGCLSIDSPLGDSILNAEPFSLESNPELAAFLDKLRIDQIFFKQHLIPSME
jgi:hypothetical protein